MDIIQQTKGNTCAACVMANIIGETEQYVLEWFEHIKPPFSDYDAMIFLIHHGILPALYLNVGTEDVESSTGGRVLVANQNLSLEIDLKKHRAYMIVESETNKSITHAVFWNGKMVIDSLHSKPMPLNNYKVLGIYPFMAKEQRAL